MLLSALAPPLEAGRVSVTEGVRRFSMPLLNRLFPFAEETGTDRPHHQVKIKSAASAQIGRRNVVDK
jgi:hypothetical protein